jgi:hypothetical protein
MSDEAKPRRRWGRWLVGGAVVVVLLIVMAYAIPDQSLRGGLAGATRELDATDPGWRLADILAARPEVALADNCVPRLLAVAAGLPAGWPDEKAWNKLESLPPNGALDAEDRAVLDGLLKGVPRPAARDLIRFPRGSFDATAFDLIRWRATPEPDRVFAAVRVLEMDALALVAEGRTDDALESARTMLSVARALKEDPTPAGQWVWLTVTPRAFSALERTLAQGQASDAALAKVAGDIVAPSVTATLRTHRAITHETLTAIGRGEMDGTEVTRTFGLRAPLLFEYGGTAVRREMVRREHLQLFRLMTRMVETSRLPPPKQFAEDAAIERDFAAARESVITNIAGALFKSVNAQGRRLAASAAGLRALVAVERYRLKHGKWPAKLDNVVPGFLDKVPEDPIDAAKLRYKRTADGVVLYSIGNDRTDDGGDVGASGKDAGYRLWDAEKRGAKP